MSRGAEEGLGGGAPQGGQGAAFAARCQPTAHGAGPSPARRGVAVADALDGAITAFAAAGLETPRLDAEVLLAHVLGVDRARLVTGGDGLEVGGAAVRLFQDAVRRRAVEREPVAYITGTRGFRRLELNVDRRALIPRPETELLVEIGLRLPHGARVLDLGTGSGAVALALKDERPDLHITGSDASRQALDLARANAAKLNLPKRGLDVQWLHADLLEAVPDAFDALLCNPPYVADSERATLAPEIVRHEPPEALFAGPDGLAAIRALLTQLATRKRIRLAALEVGAGQAQTVAELMRGAGFPAVRAERDLAGIERVVVGQRGG
jgi:release factor glutamine methyltransferase